MSCAVLVNDFLSKRGRRLKIQVILKIQYLLESNEESIKRAWLASIEAGQLQGRYRATE